jgi:hypothetical protein
VAGGPAAAGRSDERLSFPSCGAATWNLVTDFGRMDLTFAPAGTSGYTDLARDAVHLKILGAEVDVASLADVIRSKEASNREKDRLVLPVLRRLLDEGAG